MKLHGTIDRQELVKYLAKEYARCRRMERYFRSNLGEGTANACLAQAGELRFIIHLVRDNAI